MDIEIFGTTVPNEPVLVMQHQNSEDTDDNKVVTGMNMLKECSQEPKVPQFLKKHTDTQKKGEKGQSV